MELPIEIKNQIALLVEGYPIKKLQNVSEEMTNHYLNSTGNNEHLIDNDIKALVYAAVRMPATYKAVSAAIEASFKHIPYEINSVLDVGAGMGTSSIAISSLLNKDIPYICLEREKAMINLGKTLTEIAEINNLTYQEIDLAKENEIPHSDLVIASYFFNELKKEDRNIILKNLYTATDKLLIIVDNGTPKAFNMMKEMKEELLKMGGQIIAPCPNTAKCPLHENDWCHFSTRLQRSKIHKLIKNTESPFEDEKYTYIAISKVKIDMKDYQRILRYPIINSGYIDLKLCSSIGIIERRITKKDKEEYKLAKKRNMGEEF